MASFSWPLNTASSRIMRASYTRRLASRDALSSQFPLPFQRTCRGQRFLGGAVWGFRCPYSHHIGCVLREVCIGPHFS